MKNTAVVFFTAISGEKLQDEINRYFADSPFTLTNVCYGCYYDIAKGKSFHNAMVTYQFIVNKLEPVTTHSYELLLQ